jgi:chemotaxis protein methyltransferase CheR
MEDRAPVTFPDVEYELLRRLIRDKFGIDYPPSKRDLLRGRLEARLRAIGLRRFSDYYRLLRYAGDTHREWQALADGVTNNETYFFREQQQFARLAELAEAGAARTPVPGSALAVGSGPFRVLSAGCSSGEEAYSMAAVLGGASLPGGFEVRAIDVSAAKLAEARAARYGDRSFRAGEGPPRGVDLADVVAREADGAWSVRPYVRARVRFDRINLMEAEEVARLGVFDVVFCRNVIVYGHDESIPRFLRALESLLRPGGLLFLSPSESLVSYRSELRLERVGGGFAYVRDR